MQVNSPKALREYLELHAKLHVLQKDLVLLYAQQVPMAAVWLKEGCIRINFDRRYTKDYTLRGLYFLDELSSGRPLGSSAMVLAKSQIWLVTKSEITQCLELAGISH
jgi:hypothetical protein